MGDTLLSQSLMQNNADSQMRDPFAQAQNQFQSKKGNDAILSSSPMQTPLAAPALGPQAPDMGSILSKMGIEGKNLAMNDIGRVQLVGRLRAKYGDNYMQNPEAISALSAFDENLKGMDSNKQQKSMNEGLANAERTLGALMGNGGMK